ncbi:Fic family protein [Deinococcus sp. UYEF24]
MTEYQTRSLHDAPGWTDFTWDSAAVSRLLEQVNFQRGVLSGQLYLLGLDVRQEALLDALTDDAARSSRIEGEMLNEVEVKSSVARRLGLSHAGLPELSREDVGVVDVTLDATENAAAAMTGDRLARWHRALFPNGQSGVQQILTGQYRTDADGPMQVVGHRLDRRRVHFEAPAADRVPGLVEDFLAWFGSDQKLDPVIKAGLAHLHFLTIHPFEDGNGRIARALTDLLLARADQRSERHYSLSRQIQEHQREYYEVLERTQRQTTPDVTAWLTWFLERVLDAVIQTQRALGAVRIKRAYFERHQGKALNARQLAVLNRVFEPFEGRLTREKYRRLVGKQPLPGNFERQPISEDTALRDLDGLVSQGMLVRQGAGRGVHYLVLLPEGAEAFSTDLFIGG